MGLENIKKKFSQELQPKGKVKPQNRFERVEIRLVKGKAQAIKKTISFSEWMNDMEADSQEQKDFEENRDDSEESSN